MRMRTSLGCAAAVAALLGAGGAWAGEASTPTDAVDPATVSADSSSGDGASSSALEDYFAHWFDRVKQAQDSQPHWITPVATTTPRLEEEVRYDIGWQQAGNGSHLVNYGMGKGLELIPTTSTEVIINIPPYEDRTIKKPATGFGDDPILLIKQRFLSANEENGNYILTGFLGLQAPTGIKALTNHAYVVTPTLAAGKGWGPFDVQGTFGVAFPLSHADDIGTAFATNVTFQYHLGQVFWPELEVNDTAWSGGPRDGKNQVFITPGLILGRFPIAGRVKAIIGVGYQIAVSPRLVTAPALTPMYNHQVILTTRLAF
jgi:hypothetical protein